MLIMKSRCERELNLGKLDLMLRFSRLSLYLPVGLSVYLASNCTQKFRSVLYEPVGLQSYRTRPLVAPSCVLLPVTLKATLLGVLLLTSRAAADRW